MYTISKSRKERSGWRKDNSNSKRLLEGLGFKNTKTIFLKEWIGNHAHSHCSIEGDEYPVKICYDKYVGAFKTWADACYQIAVIELKKRE